MPDFIVTCADRETAAPYRLLIAADSADSATQAASRHHIASSAEAAGSSVVDGAVLRELRQIREELAVLNAKVPNRRDQKIMIRRSGALALFQYSIWAFTISVSISLACLAALGVLALIGSVVTPPK